MRLDRGHAGVLRTLGFEQTYRQTKPNPYLAMRRGDIDLGFFGMSGFNPADSYGSCVITVPDTAELHRAFADGLRSLYGKVPLAGIPRMTRPHLGESWPRPWTMQWCWPTAAASRRRPRRS